MQFQNNFKTQVKWNSKNRILKQLETDIESMIEDKEEKIKFKQKVVAFLNSESARWAQHDDNKDKEKNTIS